MSTSPMLYGRGVVRSYGRTPALRGVTLDIAEGEIVAVTGPSGCGKSTLLHCLAGILRPDAGEVGYRGQRIDGWSETARRPAAARRVRGAVPVRAAGGRAVGGRERRAAAAAGRPAAARPARPR